MIFSTPISVQFDIYLNDNILCTNQSSFDTPFLKNLKFDPINYKEQGFSLQPNNEYLRSIRTALLANCDWTLAPDSPLTLSDQQEWEKYRQALRDITVTNGSFNDDGKFLFPTPPAKTDKLQTIEEIKIKAKNEIDLMAGVTRNSVVSNGKYVDEEYRLAYDDAQDWITGGYLTDNVPSTITVWAESKKSTDKEAANDIIATREIWFEILRSIRKVRLTQKALIDSADPDMINTILIDSKTKFNALIN